MYTNQFLKYFASRLKAHKQWTTPEDARVLFDSVTAIIPEIDDLRVYLVYCHILNIPITPDTASDFARSESERGKAIHDKAR